MLGLLLLFILGLYAIFSYILYRIVRKFDNTVIYLEMLIPFWNSYLIDRTAFGKPYAYYYFWLSLVIVILLDKVTEGYLYDNIIMLAATIISASIFAIPIAFIAQKLGKNIWVYLLLMIVPQLIHIMLGFIITNIVMLVLAFDKSKPLHLPDRELTNNNTL